MRSEVRNSAVALSLTRHGCLRLMGVALLVPSVMELGRYKASLRTLHAEN